jgi:hypothetical protein
LKGILTLGYLKKIADLSEMDAPENMDMLQELGLLGGARDIKEEHFGAHFDLP